MSEDLNKNDKLKMPISIVDGVMEHYGFFDFIELQSFSIYILNALSKMEKDGFKVGVFKTVKNENGEESPLTYHVDVQDIITQLRIHLSQKISSEKKEIDEKNTV